MLGIGRMSNVSDISNTTRIEQPTQLPQPTNVPIDYYESNRKTITISKRYWLRLKQHMSYDSTFDSAIMDLLDKVEGRTTGTPEGA